MTAHRGWDPLAGTAAILAAAAILFAAHPVQAHNATYYTHYTNAQAQLGLVLSTNFVYPGQTLNLQVTAFGYISGHDGNPDPVLSIPVHCFVAGQPVGALAAPWSPYQVVPVSTTLVINLPPGTHPVSAQHTNTIEYLTETFYRYTSRHTVFLSTYYHDYFDLFHHVTVPASASQTLTVGDPAPNPNLHRLALALDTSATTNFLVEDEFTGLTGALPDASRFSCTADVVQNGSGLVNLNTEAVHRSTLCSLASAPAGQPATLRFTAYAYAEGNVVYGDGQPRGLRHGADPNNAVEFFSAQGTALGMRATRDGVSTTVTTPIATVNTLLDYEIRVTSTAAQFFVGGALIGTITNNLPATPLNFHVTTYDGGFGNVPVGLDKVQFTQPAQALRRTLSYTGTPLQSYQLLGSSNLTDWMPLSRASAATNGIATFHDSEPLGQRFYRVVQAP